METEIKFCPRCGAEIAPLTNGYFCPKCGWGEGGSNDIVEIHFGAYDSELRHWEYTIPEGYTAEIKDGKVVVKKNESEDEKIRKELVQFLKDYPYLPNGKHTRADFFAWLEKQKVQKPERIDITEMVAKYRVTDEYVEGEYNGKPVNCMIRAYEQGIRDTLLKVKEQKPAEWGEEDKENAAYIGAALEAYYKLRKEQNNTSGQTELDKAKEWLYNRFKFLRPQPHWKPSEEQMKHLKSISVGWHPDLKDCQVLSSLYNDLQKLL